MNSLVQRSESPLLSLVVPTRNRPDYAVHCIRCVLSISADDIQLVVADNSDTDTLRQIAAAELADPRLTYAYSAARLSMTENYDRGWAFARGEFVSYLGDDDGVTPWIVDATRWADSNGVDALVPSLPAQYVWPDLEMGSPSALGPGELRPRRFSGQVTVAEPISELRRCLATGAQSFEGLPKLYYGIVRRRAVEAVVQKTGSVFPGVSPDMSAAVALATVIERVHHIDFPLFVPGSSSRSNAGISGMGRHVGKLRAQPHLAADVESTWSEIVPRFYAVETIWAEAAVQAMYRCLREELLRELNLPLLYALCVVNHPAYAVKILAGFQNAVRTAGRSFPADIVALCQATVRRTVRRTRSVVGRHVRQYLHRRVAVPGLYASNIHEAVQRYAELVKPGPAPWLDHAETHS